MSTQNNGENRRALLSTIAKQQEVITNQARYINALASKVDVVSAQVDFIARIAGISEHTNEISKRADLANPGQPVPDPASSGPVQTTVEVATPEARDDARLVGETPGSVQNLPADQVDTVLRPGQTIPTSPWGTPTDVTSPVAGTETHVPNELTRLEVDVRVGDPNDPTYNFPWIIGEQPGVEPTAPAEPYLSGAAAPAAGPSAEEAAEAAGGAAAAGAEEEEDGKKAAAARNRVVAALNLARLRIQAGIASGDDLTVSAAIESDKSMTDEKIAHEINVLSGVVKSAAKQSRPSGLVPRKASSRNTPSLVNDSAPTSITATGAVTAEETADADLFF